MIRRILRLLLAAAAVVFFLWFLTPFYYGVYNVGTALGLFVCAAVFFRFGMRKTYLRLKRFFCRRKITKVLFRIIQIAASAFVIYAVTVSGFMVGAMTAQPGENDTAVVLGAQVKPWGPSILLQQRIDAAEEYLNSHPNAKAVVTGGQGSDEIMSEGQCMFNEITADGISADRVYIEDQATNTEENLRFSAEIIAESGLSKDIAVVTDSYHQLRAKIAAHNADSTLHVSAVNTEQNLAGLSTYPTYFVREWLAIPVELLKGRKA